MFTIPSPHPDTWADAFEPAPGYHGVAWATLDPDGIQTDRIVPAALWRFLATIHSAILERGLLAERHTGPAYLRVVDGAHPENYMRWHRDNQTDGGLRFATAIATDHAPVHFLFTTREEWIGLEVADTPWMTAELIDPGIITAFREDIHGVRPLPPRPGHKTAVMFCTLHPDRTCADLETTNNTSGFRHAVLPTLEAGRTDSTPTT